MIKFRTIRYVILVVTTVMLLTAPVTTLASTSDDQHADINHTVYFDESASTGCAPSTGTAPTVPGSQTGVWNSGLQPVNAAGQYPVEEYIIETLKDIAAKEGGTAANYVTKEHVIGMMAFGWGEGGNLTNDDIWNLWNNGISDPDLLAGGHSGSGVQSFKSFDTGIEANARRLTEPGYSRLITVLQNPNSTAEQFAYALSYYQKYPNNVLWATASNNEPGYYNGEISDINQARNHYDDEASTALGPPGHTQNIKLAVKLQFGGTTSGSPSGGGTGGTGGTGDGECAPTTGDGSTSSIVQTALSLAWPTNTGHTDPNSETDAYKTAFATYDKSFNNADPYTDCGAFVSTVMQMSGADTSYPKLGTAVMLPYVESAKKADGSPKYKITYNPTSTSQLNPGDILIFNSGSEGHTMIYAGPILGGAFDRIDASHFDHTPQVGNNGGVLWMFQQPNIIAAELIP